MPGDPTALDADTALATRVFMERIEGRFPVKEAFLYGSRARRTHRPNSDADLAVVLGGEVGNRSFYAREIAGVAFDVLMETGILVEALPLWESELQHPDRFRKPSLIHEIKRDGILL